MGERVWHGQPMIGGFPTGVSVAARASERKQRMSGAGSSSVYRGVVRFLDAMRGREASAVVAAPRRFEGRGASFFGSTVAVSLVVAVLVAVGASMAAEAMAAPKSFGGFVGRVTDPTNNFGGRFLQPRDAVVWQGADVGGAADDKVFVVEGLGDNSRVQRLDAEGNFELMWGKDVIAQGAAGDSGGGFEVCSVAVDCKSGGPAPAVAKGEFDQPSGIAVDQSSGDVFVWDRNNVRVQKFTKDGVFLLMFGKGVNATTGGDVCTQASGDVCQAGSAGAGDAQLGSSSAQAQLAVSPVTGDVFVADAQNRRVMQFTSTGGFVRGWGFGVDTAIGQFEVCTAASGCNIANAAGPANGQFASGNPVGVAVDSQNVVYLTDSSTGATANRIVRFDADSAPASGDATAALLDPINQTSNGGPLLVGTSTGLEIDPDTDDAGPDEESLLAVRDPSAGDTVVEELDIPTEAGETPADPVTVAMTHTYVATPARGLAVSSASDTIFLAYSGIDFTACTLVGSCAGLFALTPASGAQVLGGVSASDPTATTAAVVVGVDPNGLGTVYVEYSVDGVTWVRTPNRYVIGVDEVSVAVPLSGLSPNTTYRVRAVGEKYVSLTEKATAVSAESVFLTDMAAPGATTSGSADRTDTGAQLRGLVDPNGASTSYRFEYGPAGQGFGSRVPVPDAFAGSGNDPALVVQSIGGLQPGTAYQYRLVATNAAGVSVGDTVAFTTRQPPAGETSPPDRAYELVSPAYKISGVGVGTWGLSPLAISGLTGMAAHDGERFAAQGSLGSMLVDAPFAFANDWALGERTPQGWIHRPASTRGGYDQEDYRFLLMRGATPDLSRMMWMSNSGATLNLFPEQEGWLRAVFPVFLSDWEGRWELVTPTDPSQAGVDTIAGAYALSADGSHAVVSGNIRGVAGSADPTLDQLAGTRAVYVDRIPGQLSDSFPGSGQRSPVGVCSGGTLIPERLASGGQTAQPCSAAVEYAPGEFRDAALISTGGASIGTGTDPSQNVVSQDGSRVFFMSPDPNPAPVGSEVSVCSGSGLSTSCPAQLYVRQTNTDGSVSTRWVSQTEVAGQAASLIGEVRFEGASEDGDKVFFRTRAPLTADDRNGGQSAPAMTGTPAVGSSDLYMYDLPDGPDGDPATADGDPAGGDLVRISAGPNGDGDCNLGNLRFVSADGARVYLTCAAPLAGVPIHSNGGITSPSGSTTATTTTNLYLYDSTRLQAERWRFVAQLPVGNPVNSPLGRCATTGRAARSPLNGGTGDDVSFDSLANCVRATADGRFMTFWTDGRLVADDPDSTSGDIYAYDADAEELVRVTAPQGGIGGDYVCTGAASGPMCHGDPGIGESNDTLSRLGLVADPSVDGDRVAFFQSRSRLVAEDLDGEYDVYQWRNGKLSLLSAGDTAGEGVFYTGNDGSGRNIYMSSRARLTWQDVDDVMDVYTARVDGGIDQPVPSPVCEVLAGGCQGPGLSLGGVAVDSTRAGGGNTSSPRLTVSVAGVSGKARRRAARSGVIALRVRTSGAASVTAVATGRVGGRSRRLGRATTRAERAGVRVLRLRLNRVALGRLKAGKRLRVAIVARAGDSRSSTTTMTLKRRSR